MRYYENKAKDQAKLFQSLPEKTQRALEQQLPRREVEQRKSVYGCTMPQIIKEAKEFAKEWKKTIDDVSLEHYHYNDYGSDSSALDMHVNGLETEEQHHSRMWETHDANSRRDEYERKEFERLKAKFK